LDIVLDIPNVPPIAPDVAAPLNLVLAFPNLPPVAPVGIPPPPPPPPAAAAAAAVAPANVSGGYLFLSYEFY
jgi:hypothetical protein